MKLAIPDFCLVVLIGASGSGKSTFARRHFKRTEIISSDTARGLVCDDENDLDATADAFDHISGDVFRRDDNGFHYFVGRSDDMFVSGGENIYPADVERMLERHPGVAQAAVVPVDDDIKGTKPVAFVIRKPGHNPAEDDIKAYALQSAPAYQHPRAVWFVDELPLASTNKLDRAALKALAASKIGR